MSSAIEFPMPKSIVVDEATMTDTYAKFTAQPFQSGFGHTLGNSLRRVLLSSLEGAAICSVKIDGARHEFDSVNNVIEDVTEIVLNLKRVRLNVSMGDETIKTLQIVANKAGKVTAANIVNDGTVEILNPDQLICTLDKSKPFRAEIEVVCGKGYRPSETAKRIVGKIPVDCMFSPVTRVNYQVGAARVGSETEMDSLDIEIWTDGRISPRAALEKAAFILCDHLKPFIGANMAVAKMELTEEEQKLFKLLSSDIEILDLSVRSSNCLKGADLKLVYELCVQNQAKIMKFRNFGKKSLDDIQEKLKKHGLELGMTFSPALTAALDAEVAKVKPKANEENK